MQRIPSTKPLAPLIGSFLLPLSLGWYASLMLPLWRGAAICGHVGLLNGHCPGCYEALALAAAVALIGAGASPSTLHARIRS